MKRLFKEEKTGLKTGSRVKFSFVCTLLFFQNYFPQVPVNGFCNFNSIEVPAGYDHLIQTEMIDDKVTDFSLYSPDKKILILLKSENGSAIDNSITKIKSAFEVSSLLQINYNKKLKDQFIFTSRKNRLTGILEISSTNSIKVITKLEFDSYPENITAADINDDGVNEYLLSGSGFDGLSILHLMENRLGENKIISGSNYKKALFAELDNDGYPDILAYNLINRSLEFFYNDSQGNFDLVRSIDAGEIYSNILSVDINKDGYDDLIFSEKSGISIIYGDAESRYFDRNLIRTGYSANIISLGDFNSDGSIDIVYVEKSSGVMSVVFAKKRGGYYDEIIYTRKPELSDLIVFRENLNANIALLSKSGFLYIFSNLNSALLTSEINLVPAGDPAAIGTFDKGNDGISDLYFVDQVNNSLVIYLRDDELVPNNIYSIPLADNYTDIRTDETFPSEKTFYCFTTGGKLIEVVRLNFKNNKIQKKQLYSPGPLEDLKISRTDSSLVEVYIVYNKGNKLHVGKYDHRDLSITFKEFPAVDLNVVNAKLMLNDKLAIYYWKESSDTLTFTKADIKTGPNEYTEYFSLPKPDGIKIVTVTGESESTNPFIFSMIISNKNNTAISNSVTEPGIYFPFDNETELKPKHNHKLFLSRGKSSGERKLMVYIPEEKLLSRFEFLSDGKNYKIVPVMEVENIYDYVVDRSDDGDHQLIYSNKKEGCISIIQLEQ